MLVPPPRALAARATRALDALAALAVRVTLALLAGAALAVCPTPPTGEDLPPPDPPLLVVPLEAGRPTCLAAAVALGPARARTELVLHDGAPRALHLALGRPARTADARPGEEVPCHAPA